MTCQSTTAGSRSSPVPEFFFCQLPTTLESAAARLVEGSFYVTIIIIYRPAAAHTQFFQEFSALLIAVQQERVILVG